MAAWDTFYNNIQYKLFPNISYMFLLNFNKHNDILFSAYYLPSMLQGPSIPTSHEYLVTLIAPLHSCLGRENEASMRSLGDGQ